MWTSLGSVFAVFMCGLVAEFDEVAALAVVVVPLAVSFVQSVGLC